MPLSKFKSSKQNPRIPKPELR